MQTHGKDLLVSADVVFFPHVANKDPSTKGDRAADATVRGKIADVISAEFIERAGTSERSRTSCEGSERKLFISFPFKREVGSRT